MLLFTKIIGVTALGAASWFGFDRHRSDAYDAPRRVETRESCASERYEPRFERGYVQRIERNDRCDEGRRFDDRAPRGDHDRRVEFRRRR